MLRRALCLILSLPAALAATGAVACSMDMRPVRERVEKIKADPDVRLVKGVFHFEEVRGEPMNDPDHPGWLLDAVILGKVETLRGTAFETAHAAPDESTTCYVGTYFKPVTEASGTFYLSRRKTDGRYELLHWDGEYLPVRSGAAQ
jgi:hypothetical protein